MNSSPKILVFKLRSLIYTLLLLFFGILLIVCLVLMFSPKQKRDGQVLPDTARSMTPERQTQSTASTNPDPANTNRTEKNTGVSIRNSRYIPGVYTASVPLGDSAADVEVTLNADRIQAIRLVNLSEATAAAFPLVSPSFENISSQILAKQSTDEVTAPAENRYTSQLLLSVISGILQRAASVECPCRATVLLSCQEKNIPVKAYHFAGMFFYQEYPSSVSDPNRFHAAILSIFL